MEYLCLPCLGQFHWSFISNTDFALADFFSSIWHTNIFFYSFFCQVCPWYFSESNKLVSLLGKKKHSFAFFLFMSSQVLDVLHSSIYFKSNPVAGRCFGGFLVNLPGYFPYQWLAVLWQSSQGNIQAGSWRTNTNLISCLFTVEFLVVFFHLTFDGKNICKELLEIWNSHFR